MAKKKLETLAESLRSTIDRHPTASYDEIITSLLFILVGIVVSTSKDNKDAIKYLNHLHKGLKEKISIIPPQYFKQRKEK